MKDYVVNNFKEKYSQYAVGQSLPIWGDLEGWSRETMFEKYPSISPYTYCGNNPVKRIDPTGEDEYEFDRKGNLVNIIENKNADIVRVLRKNGKERNSKTFEYGILFVLVKKNYGLIQITLEKLTLQYLL